MSNPTPPPMTTTMRPSKQGVAHAVSNDGRGTPSLDKPPASTELWSNFWTPHWRLNAVSVSTWMLQTKRRLKATSRQATA